MRGPTARGGHAERVHRCARQQRRRRGGGGRLAVRRRAARGLPTVSLLGWEGLALSSSRPGRDGCGAGLTRLSLKM